MVDGVAAAAAVEVEREAVALVEDEPDDPAEAGVAEEPDEVVAWALEAVEWVACETAR